MSNYVSINSYPSSYTLSSGTTWASNTTATIVLNDVPVQHAKPKTEVDRMLADVEGVCALAR